MNILLTGCSSYIGKYITESLIKDGNYVIGISRTDPNVNHKCFKWIKCDLSVGEINLKKYEIDIVVHIAGCAWQNKHVLNYIDSNILTTYNLLKMINKIKPKIVLYTSSRDIYGEIDSKILIEDNKIINPNVYGMTKYLGEQLLLSYNSTIIFRLPGVIGKGSHGWIQSIYDKLSNQADIEFFNTPFNNLIHLKDLYGVINTFIKNVDTNNNKIRNNEVINISSVGVVDSLEIVEYMKERLFSESILRIISDSDNFFTISNEKLLKYYKPMTTIESIETYLNDMIEN